MANGSLAVLPLRVNLGVACAFRHTGLCKVRSQPAKSHMTEKIRDPRYYVVGGPVQPDRDCYQHRYADAELFRRISDGEYCHVLAQRQTGKTSLAASTARKLRERGTLVAMVDLTQISSEDPSENAGRWYYSIAYRIVRELRIRADVQTWWKERGGLTNLQRMREFFIEVVLQETTQPIAILFDRIEATKDEPLAQDLFSAIRACYDARITDSVFQRLSFSMFGSSSPAELVKDLHGSPFEISVEIPLPDFSAQEMAGLMAGLGDPLPEAQAILSRVWTWTRGHPYLSQKIFRGLARRKGELSDEIVDELVQTQFLSPNTLREEPHLSAIADCLAAEGPGRSARLNLYGRIRKGVEVSYDSSSLAQRDLLTTGVVSIGDGGVLRVRNEIYAMVFGMRWVNQKLPYGIKGIGLAAAILLLVLAVPIWYAEYLPRPYVSALSIANQDYEVAEDAYESLHMLPGYAATADRLFDEFLIRLSRSANTLPEIMRIHDRLAVTPEGSETASSLLAEFWQRRSNEAANQGDRDAALITALEAMQQPNDLRRQLAAELVGRDYRYLAGTLHSKAELKAIEADEASGLLTVLDVRNNIDLWRIDGDRPRLVRSDTLIAEERLELEERRLVEQLNASPRLLIKTNHAQPEQVILHVRAPSGQQARLNLADGRVINNYLRAFDFAMHPELRNLQGADYAGNWTIALSDMEQGISGELLDWGLVTVNISDVTTANYVPQPIPEPRSSENAKVLLGPGGRLALSWPADRQTQGSILVWDLASDDVLARIPRDNGFIDAQFVLGGERVATIEPRQITVWETATGKKLGRIELNTSASRIWRLSEDGRYIAIKTLLQDAAPGIAVWDLTKIRRLGRPITAENAATVALDASGNYLAIGGRDPWVRVWSLNEGTLIREFEHSSPLRSLKFDLSGEWLATVDLSNTFRLWNMVEGGVPVVERLGSSIWKVDFSTDSSRLLVGSSDRAYEIIYLPEARGTGVRLHHAMIDSSSATSARAPAPIVLADRNVVVTNDAGRSIKVWSIPAAQASMTPRVKSLPGGTLATLSADGKRIAVGTSVGDVRVYAVGAPGGILLGGADRADALSDNKGIVNLKFSDNGKMLASASMTGQVQVWDVATGTPRDLLIIHPDGAAHDFVFTDADRYLISASRREVIVTDVGDGEIRARLRIQANHPQLAVAAATGEVFIADDLDGVTAWNWRTGQSSRIVESAYQIRKVAVSADGARLVTASDERELTVWDVSTRAPLAQTARAAAKVDDMWVAGNDTRLVVQAGPWLQSLSLFPNGIAALHTRLLNVAPAAARPGADGRSAIVLSTSSSSRPVVSNEKIDMPGSKMLEGEPEELRSYWRERLSLSLDTDGSVTPTLNNSASVSETQPKNFQ